MKFFFIGILSVFITFVYAQTTPLTDNNLISSQAVVEPVVKNDLHAKLEIENDGVLTVKEGDSFVATLTLWPIKNVSPGEFSQKYTNENFLDHFYVSKIIEEGYSQNNPEAYTVKLRMILVRHFDIRNFILWNYRSLNVPVSITNLNPIPLKGRNKDFILLQQFYSTGETNYLPVFILSLFFLMVIIFLTVKHLKYKTEKEKELAFRLQWARQFKSADTREDYENIYASRSEWEKCIEIKTPEMIEFYETLNEHQFKKEWTEHEAIEVKESFEQIRGILN